MIRDYLGFNMSPWYRTIIAAIENIPSWEIREVPEEPDSSSADELSDLSGSE